MWMPNHYHLVLTDRNAELPDFMRDLNSHISKATNAVRGVRGENFERRGYNAVVVADGARMLRHCAYTEANPCRANLVEFASDWESVTSARMEYDEEKVVRRPDSGLWSQVKAGDQGRMDPKRAEFCGRIACPEMASFRLVRSPCLNGGDEAKTRAEVRMLVAELEEDARKIREWLGQGVMGMRRVQRVNYMASPTGREGVLWDRARGIGR